MTWAAGASCFVGMVVNRPAAVSPLWVLCVGDSACSPACPVRCCVSLGYSLMTYLQEGVFACHTSYFQYYDILQFTS